MSLCLSTAPWRHMRWAESNFHALLTSRSLEILGSSAFLSFSCGATAILGPRMPLCWGLEVTQKHTTLGITPLDEWSARRRDLYPDNTQYSQETDILALGGIRTGNPSKRAVAYPRLRATAGIGVLHRLVALIPGKRPRNYWMAAKTKCWGCADDRSWFFGLRLNFLPTSPQFRLNNNGIVNK